MGKVSAYKTVSSTHASDLDALVTAQIALGWEVEGDPVITNSGIIQKLVKREADGTDIVAFNTHIAVQTGLTVIDAEAHTVVLEVANGTSLTGLAFQMTLSPGAESDIDTPQTFVDGVAKEFTITSESGDEQVWEVTVDVAGA